MALWGSAFHPQFSTDVWMFGVMIARLAFDMSDTEFYDKFPEEDSCHFENLLMQHDNSWVRYLTYEGGILLRPQLHWVKKDIDILLRKILVVDPLKRPTMSEITGSLRRLAIRAKIHQFLMSL